MWREVTSGDGAGSLVNLYNYEEALAEGQRGKLSFMLRTPISSDIAEELRDKLEQAGVLDAEVHTLSTSGNQMEILFRKGFPWLAVIVAIVLGMLVLAIIIVSWQFFKEAEEVIPKPILIAGVVVGILLLAVIVFMLVKRQIPASITGGEG